MMANLAPFALVDALINQGVNQLLANASATWQGGEPFGVIFERSPHDALGDVIVGRVTCGLPLACAPGLEQGGVLVIDGKAWTVAEPVVGDSSGWAVVQLQAGGEAYDAEGVHG